MAKKKSGIKIKPSKRGTFTAWCKRQGYNGVTQECIRAGLNSKSAAIRKKANFARNARKWNKGKVKGNSNMDIAAAIESAAGVTPGGGEFRSSIQGNCSVKLPFREGQ
jgi:hypothetical protein